MQVERYTDGGRVAVLYSPGFGGGWSTWADDEYAETLLFDKRLVQAALDQISRAEVEELLQDILGDVYVYTGGWPVAVGWVSKGDIVIIDEYDGSESVTTKYKIVGYTA